MPGMDGYQFLSAFRRESQTPVIIITAREEETDAVLGLELGADDYVIKPFRMRELVARIRATLRRKNGQPEPQEYLRVGEILLDRGSHLVSVRGESVNLTPLEFDLLQTLMRTPGKVFTRSELVDRLFESGFTGLESTLNVCNAEFTTKNRTRSPSQYLETVFGVGYRIAQVGSMKRSISLKLALAFILTAVLTALLLTIVFLSLPVPVLSNLFSTNSFTKLAEVTDYLPINKAGMVWRIFWRLPWWHGGNGT